MRTVAALLVLASLWGEVGARVASARGAKAFEKKEYAKAVEEFRRAHELSPSPRNAFNLGTAEIAAGQREQVMIDFSHANARKDHRRQVEVGHDVAAQIAAGEPVSLEVSRCAS